ncbi:hypothetical protein LA76x_2350 [Lysobacter antibioticus]|uniref:Uncharacterized protein n=1 Tax=Lysobacter antibioticus TaxID=84531 RepID=A0A0S2FAG6_LYSAN|nr:hypothetical protein LA76x_2350 [Lysobacter antibioticus]
MTTGALLQAQQGPDAGRIDPGIAGPARFDGVEPNPPSGRR